MLLPPFVFPSRLFPDSLLIVCFVKVFICKKRDLYCTLIYAIKVSLFHHDTDERFLIEIDDAANTKRCQLLPFIKNDDKRLKKPCQPLNFPFPGYLSLTFSRFPLPQAYPCQESSEPALRQGLPRTGSFPLRERRQVWPVSDLPVP